MTTIPSDPDALLRRDPTATALTEAGYQTSPTTLATLASRGGGPQFRKYGRYPVYRWGDALEWAKSRLSPPVYSTSELDTCRSRRPASPAARVHAGRTAPAERAV
jgi:hypothetical protein